MADIQTYLDQIKNAQYGKDVRQSIHDGIKQCYEDGKAGAIDLKAREDIASLNSSLAKIALTNIASVNFGYDNQNAFNIDFNLPKGHITKIVFENTGIRYLYFDGSDWTTIWNK